MRRTFLLCLSVAACDTPPPTPGEYEPSGPVAFVDGGVEVHQDLLRAALGRMPPEQRGQMSIEDQAKLGADAVMLTQNLYKRALDLHLEDTPEGQVRLALAAREALASIALEHLTAEAITEEGVKAAYEERKVQFIRPQAKVRQIVLDTEEAAVAVVEAIHAGGDVAMLARERSTDRGTGARGGELGWIVKGQLPEPLDGAVFSGEGAALVGPLETKGRWVVFSVEERRDRIPLEDVRVQLENVIRQEAVETEIRSIRESIKPEWKLAPALALQDKAAP